MIELLELFFTSMVFVNDSPQEWFSSKINSRILQLIFQIHRALTLMSSLARAARFLPREAQKNAIGVVLKGRHFGTEFAEESCRVFPGSAVTFSVSIRYTHI